MSNEDLILNTIKLKGPVLPVDIAKVIDKDILFASAYLSDLTSTGKLKISNTKIGGSPVYYMPGQEVKLQNLYQYLNPKDQAAFNKLKNYKILRDDQLEPLTRIALRNIKDFAVLLSVNFNLKKILFWKWYLLSNNEANDLIKRQLQPRPEIKKETRSIERQKIKEKAVEIRKPLPEKTEDQKEIIRKIKEQLSREDTEKQKELISREKRKPKQDIFFNQLTDYFNNKRIEISSSNIIRKNSEIDFIVRIPSIIGDLKYYCKAKNKKNINEKDLSEVFVQGQLKKLPAIFLITGKLTKKAKELLTTEFNKGIIVKAIQ